MEMLTDRRSRIGLKNDARSAGIIIIIIIFHWGAFLLFGASIFHPATRSKFLRIKRVPRASLLRDLISYVKEARNNIRYIFIYVYISFFLYMIPISAN